MKDSTAPHRGFEVRLKILPVLGQNPFFEISPLFEKSSFIKNFQKYFRSCFETSTRRCRIFHWSFWYQYWSFESQRPLAVPPFFAWAPLKLLSYTPACPYAPKLGNIILLPNDRIFRALSDGTYRIFSVPDLKNKDLNVILFINYE